MAAGVSNLGLEQGVTFRFALVWRHAPTQEQLLAAQPGTPHDLTGAVAWMQIRRAVADQVLITLSSTSGGGITLGGDNGRIDFTVSAAASRDRFTESDGRPITSAVYDLYVTETGGDTYRLLKGKVTIDPAVTGEAPA
jgi:hypothetical protein